MRYIDSNVFIYPIIYDAEAEPKASKAKEILTKVAAGSLRAATASLSWDEVTWIARELLGVEIAKTQGRKLLRFPNLKFLSVDEKAIREAQRLVERYGLKPRDAIHAGCAIGNGIEDIITDDSDFDTIGEIRRIRLEEAVKLF